MGYPMTYRRVVTRNQLDPSQRVLPVMPELLRDDLRRLEQDQQDERQLARYAACAGVSPAQAAIILDAFFHGFPITP